MWLIVPACTIAPAPPLLPYLHPPCSPTALRSPLLISAHKCPHALHMGIQHHYMFMQALRCIRLYSRGIGMISVNNV